SLAVVAVVEAGNIGCNQLTLTGRERARPAQQDLDQFVEWLCGFWTEGHGSANSRQFWVECDMGHVDPSFQGSEDSVAVTGTVFMGAKRRCSSPPPSTMAAPQMAGTGSCRRISRAIAPAQRIKMIGAVGYHHLRTGIFRRKSVETESA